LPGLSSPYCYAAIEQAVVSAKIINDLRFKIFDLRFCGKKVLHLALKSDGDAKDLSNG